MLDRCRALEARSAALYRRFAAAARDDPERCVLWTDLARDEEQHARSLDDLRERVPIVETWRTELVGWDDAVRGVEATLAAAERLPGDADVEQQLAAALDLELTEIEPLRQALLVTGHRPEHLAEDHALRLADAAERYTTDPHVPAAGGAHPRLEPRRRARHQRLTPYHRQTAAVARAAVTARGAPVARSARSTDRATSQRTRGAALREVDRLVGIGSVGRERLAAAQTSPDDRVGRTADEQQDAHPRAARRAPPAPAGPRRAGRSRRG